MPNLLLELFSEEIPSRFQRKGAENLRMAVTGAMVEAGITYEGAKAYWTPRRLVLDVRGLSARTADMRTEKKGPRIDAGEKVIEGFMRGAGIQSLEQAEIRNDSKKGDFYVVTSEKPGRDAAEIIAELMPDLIKGKAWPKSMRWGERSADSGSLKWIRPLQSVLCLFGPEAGPMEVMDFEVEGLHSGNRTQGHRFMAPDIFPVIHFDDYAAHLEKAKVMLDAETRKDTIRTEAENLVFANGLELVADEQLLDEVSGLVEWPTVLMGTFGEEYLDIPGPVIRLTIRENQKCFVTRKSGSNELANHFIMVSNIVPVDGGAEVCRGNARVVNARLSDARFFWETDLRQIHSPKGFDPWIEKLDEVTFHTKLGSQGERVRRIVALAEVLAPAVGAIPQQAVEAARLCKADLNSAMIYEFPELQGKMGRIYAERAGWDKAVSLAIEEHYSPLGPSDEVPTCQVSVTVALADKLDTLTGFWKIDEKPTGSKDPYALRRAALGVIRLVLENNVRLPLLTCMDTDLLSFFHDRLKVYLRDQDIRHDLIDAVLDARSDDLLIAFRKAQALQGLIDSSDGINLLAGYKRAANILAAEEKKGTAIIGEVCEDVFIVDAEKALNTAIMTVAVDVESALSAEDFEGAMAALAALRTPVDAFFENVLVNDENPDIRANRLSLLNKIRTAITSVANFSRING